MEKKKTLIKKARILKERFAFEKAEIRTSFLCDAEIQINGIYLTLDYITGRAVSEVTEILGHDFAIQSDSRNNYRIAINID